MADAMSGDEAVRDAHDFQNGLETGFEEGRYVGPYGAMGDNGVIIL